MSVGFFSPTAVKRYPFNPGIVRAPGLGLRYLPDHFINQGCTGFWPLNDGAGRSGITELSNPGGLTTSTSGDGGGWAAGDGRIASTVWDGNDYPTQGFPLASGVGVAGHAIGDSVSDNPFTACGWAKFETGEDRATVVARAHKSVSGTEIEYLFGNDSNNNLAIFIYDLSGSDRIGRKTSLTLAGEGLYDSWHHYAFTYDGSGNESGIKLFIDGIRVDDTSNSAGSYTACHFFSSRTTDIGCRFPADVAEGGGLEDAINGQICNVRIWQRQLSEADIKLLYTDPWIGTSHHASRQTFFTPPLRSTILPNVQPARISKWGTRLDWEDSINLGVQGVYHLGRQGTGATNLVPWNGDLTQVGNPFGNRYDNHIGIYDAFNGTDSYVGSFDVSGWSQVTMACWVRCPDDESAGARAMSIFHSGGDDIRVWFPNNSDAHFAVDDGTAYQSNFAASADWEDGVWHFYVGTFDGNEVKAYFDGKLVNTTGSASFNFATADGAFRIGRTATASGDSLTGDITLPRVWSRAITADEALRLYVDPFAGMMTFDAPFRYSAAPVIEPEPDPDPTFNVYYLAAILGGRVL